MPLHILHIIPALPFGGAERCVVDIANHTDPERFRHTIVVFRNKLPMKSELDAATPVVFLEKNGKPFRAFIRELRRTIEDERPDIVHTHLFGGDAWGRIAALPLAIPILSTEHNINLHEGAGKRLVKLYLRGASARYTACSEAVKIWMTRAYRITRPIDVIRYGIPLERFSGIPPIEVQSPVRFLVLGRLTRQKGQDILLRALKDMPHAPWTLTIAGDGEDEKKLRGMAERFGLSPRVSFLPPTHDVPALFASHHALLVPSRWEGLGIVIMEAMAAGRLVVASDTGGISEIVSNKKTGILLPPGDAHAWWAALRDVALRFSGYRRIASAGREYALAHFGMDRMIGEYERVYEEMIKKC